MNKKSAILLCLSLAAAAILVYTNMPSLIGAQPGDAHDPLVTRRYVDNRINELTAQIARLEEMISGGHTAPQAPAGAPQQAPTAPQAPAVPPDGTQRPPAGHDEFIRNLEVATFTTYSVPRGRRIYFEAGAMFILRTGNVTAVTGPSGFADVTAGRDVTNGETISHNHLLVVPVADGRGLQFNTNGLIMILGGYEVAN